METQRLIRFLRRVALLNLVLATAAAVVIAVAFKTWELPLTIFWSAVLFSAVLYLQTSTAEGVQRNARQLEVLRTELRDGLNTRQRIAELEAENAELHLIAQTALDQRDSQ